MKNSRIGKFYVSRPLIEEDVDHIIEVLDLLKFVPYRVEMLEYRDEFEYVGYSPKFKKIELGEIVPEYIIKTVVNDVGEITNVIATEVK